MSDTPCKYCTKRYQGCHVVCEIGIAADAEHAKRKELIEQERDMYMAIKTLSITSKNKPRQSINNVAYKQDY